jgi:hypothetical protein
VLAAIAVFAALGAIIGAPGFASVIDGEISFPGRSIPTMTAYACDLDTARIRAVPIAADQTRFSIEVPPGRYVVFLAPKEPGAPNIYGAFTQFSVCTAHQGAEGCADHSLVTIGLVGRAAHARVTVDDWYLSDDIAERIDHLLGGGGNAVAEPLGAPRFSEYKIAPMEPTSALPPEPAATAESATERARLQLARASGPNFSGYLTLTLAPCGSDCEHLVLLDWRSGKIIESPDPIDLHGNLPCRGDEALSFRRDSRLLSVSHAHGSRIVTQYFLWKQDTEALVLTAEYERNAQQFCAASPP